MNASNETLSTREAAKVLGLSLGTVQKMVEVGELLAWKTSGGHRRIYKSSLHDYATRRQNFTLSLSFKEHKTHLSLLVVEDNLALQKLYQTKIESWGLPIHLTIVGDGLSGLLAIAREKPDLLIADLKMDGVDGAEMINTLRKDNLFNMMDIIVVTGLAPEEVAAKPLPKDVAIFYKPVPFHTLSGYVSAKLAAMNKKSI